MENDIEVFANQIISELGIGDLPEEKQEGILRQMVELWLKRLSAETFERLGEEKTDEYLKYAETHTPEESSQFIKSALPDYDSWAIDLRNRFLAEMKSLTNG